MNSMKKITTSLLGTYLDGWADLIEGMGSKSEAVKDGLILQLKERNMPDVAVEEVTAKPGVFVSDYRNYTITTTFPGATTTIFVGAHGQDLYTSWRTYLQPPVNWKLLKFVAILITALVLLGSIPSGMAE